MMAIIDSTASTCTITGFDDAFGSSGSEKRMNPYVPIFSITPARITDPAVGASVCASGSHVWNGNIGTFTANPTKKARKIHHWRLYGMFSCWNAVMSNEYTPVTLWE